VTDRKSAVISLETAMSRMVFPVRPECAVQSLDTIASANEQSDIRFASANL